MFCFASENITKPWKYRVLRLSKTLHGVALVGFIIFGRGIASFSLPDVARIDTESRRHTMYQSMVGPTKPTMFQIPPFDDPTLIAR